MSSHASAEEAADRHWLAAAAVAMLLLSLALEFALRVPLRLPGHRALPEALVLLLGLELTPWRLPRSLWLEVVVGAALGAGRTLLLTGPHGPPFGVKLFGGICFGTLAGALAHLAIRFASRRSG
jgi:hypothetical protein